MASESNTSIKTVATAQPSSGSLHIAQSPKREKNKDDDTSTTRPPISAATRFIVTLCVLFTQGLVLVLLQRMVASKSSFGRQFGGFFTLFSAFFTSEWIRIHSFALTRQKRAFFDEVNILETYQPRARTMGHLFQPDPPTPGPVVKISDDPNLPQRSDSEKAAFNANRDAHYANMFEYAMRVAKEAEETDKQAVEAQKARLAAEEAGNKSGKSDSSTTTAHPKGEPLYDDVSNNNAATPTTPATVSTASLPLLENVEGGTTLELPPSLREKMDASAKSPADMQDISGGSTTLTAPTTAPGTSTGTGTTTAPTTDGMTEKTGNSSATDVKSGKKRRKKNK